MRLGARGGAAPEPAGGEPAWTLWGRGDRGSFRGRTYEVDGQTSSVYLGLDRGRSGSVFGLALSRSAGDVDYRSERSGEGMLSAELATLLPYAHWTLGEGLTAWALLGAGAGEVTLSDAQEENQVTDLTRELVAGGLRRALRDGSKYGLALKGDLFATRIKTSSEEGLDAVSADAYRARLLLEGRADWSLSEHGRLSPIVEVGGRLDGGDSASGLGAELGARLKYSNSAAGLEVEAQGRHLAAHEEDGFAAWGGGLMIRIGAQGHGGLGFALSLSPSWGLTSGGGSSLWRSDGRMAPLTDSSSYGVGRDQGDASWVPERSDVRLQYGLNAWRGTLAPFASLAMQGATPSRTQLGLRFERQAKLRLEFIVERAERTDASAQHRFGLSLFYAFGRPPSQKARLHDSGPPQKDADANPQAAPVRADFEPPLDSKMNEDKNGDADGRQCVVAQC